MNLEKIKSLIYKYKFYLIIGAIIIVIFLWIEKKNNSSEDNLNNFNAEHQEFVRKPVSNKSEEAQKESDSSEKVQTEPKIKDVTCDISGAVKEQGVYTLKKGARLNELIEAAGGVTARAQLKNVNRALILKDQDKVHIPYVGEKIKRTEIVVSANGNTGIDDSTNESDSVGQSDNHKININVADTAELQKLSGIGEKKAQQIIAYRQKNGKFQKIEDLKLVSGIGDKTFEALKNQLEV